MLLVGAQLLIWAATGSYMVIMNIDYIHGDSLVVSNKATNGQNSPITIDANKIKTSIKEIQSRYPTAEQISLKMLQDKAVYQFRDDKQWRLVNAINGKLLAAINKEQAQAIAQSYYSGKGEINNSLLLTTPNGEISPRILPAWQISFDDFAAPRLYISAQTGELVTKRHNFWVIFDWLFRFHIMDYGEDEDASNILLLVVALISLTACITGVVLTYVSFIKVRGKSIQMPTHKRAKKVMPWIRFFHRWLSLLVFIQLFIWLGTGLYFNLMDHQKASGNQHRQRLVENTKQFVTEKLLPMKQVLQQYPLAQEIRLVERLNQPFYLVTLSRGLYSHFPRQQQLISAVDGRQFELNTAVVNQLAQRSYDGSAEPRSSTQLFGLIKELPKQQNSLWKVDFNDELNTSVYIDAQNASIIGHVDDDKRLADLMFTLHFMDYGVLNEITGNKLGGFNNALIIFFALLTLLFSLTGVYWLAHLVKNKQFRWSFLK
jgi:uncharacterized iron-regulated membrane protein